MRPPAPWSLASFRTLKERSIRPRVAAIAATPNAIASDPIVSPPTASMSSGSTSRNASATSSMPSGRQVVCLASMNQVLRLPERSTKSPVLIACSRRCAISASVTADVMTTRDARRGRTAR